MYVCMYVCTYVCMYVRTYVCMYVCTYVRMYVSTYVCMYVCPYFVNIIVHHQPCFSSTQFFAISIILYRNFEKIKNILVAKNLTNDRQVT
jgi:hypothetical protein